MRKGRQAFLIILLILILIGGGAFAFLASRPVCTFVTDHLPADYVKRLSKPEALTGDWRLDIVEAAEFSDDGDVVIDFSKDGVATDRPSMRPFFTPLEIFSPLLPELAGERITYIYDEEKEPHTELLEVLEEMFPDLETVSYAGEMEKSSFAVLRGGLVEGSVLLIPDLYPVMEFVRSLESPRIAVDWIDAAALETMTPEFVASPDWDSIVRDLFSENV